ncbi:MAG: peptide MFS transporter [Acidobacteriota bacterium]
MTTADSELAAIPFEKTERVQWFGHPRGLATLFFTEMWERFSYYGMRALLILYMVAPLAGGGLAFSTPHAALIYGWYTMLVYAMCIPGGFVADRIIGQYNAVLIGGIVIAAGHFSMAVPRIEFFFLGLGLIIIGTGLLKPNVSSMVGMLYSRSDSRRDAGFSLYYMGINIGATSAPIVCGWLGQRVNWHLGFAAAGVGMVLGLIQYVLGRRHLDPARAQIALRKTEKKERTAVAPLTPQDWRNMGLIGILFVFALIFWSAFEQAGSTLTLFADRYTRTSIFGFSFPSSWFQSEQPLFVITLAPVFALLWVRLGKREPSGLLKFAIGLFLVGLGFLLLAPAAHIAQSSGVKVSPMWLTGLYLLHTLGELCLSPVGLSLVTKLAPKRLLGFMMGVWFLAASFGNFIAGWVAGFSDRVPLSRLFTTVFAVAACGGVIALVLSRGRLSNAQTTETESSESV